jgi:hypothetical protein
VRAGDQRPQAGLQRQPTTLALGHFCFRLPATASSVKRGVSLCAKSGSRQTGRVLPSNETRRWAVPGSNGRPPACKARASAAVYRRLSLIPLGERWTAHSCCALLRFVASKPLPHDRFSVGDPLPLSRESASGAASLSSEPVAGRRSAPATNSPGRLPCGTDAGGCCADRRSWAPRGPSAAMRRAVLPTSR